MNLPATWQILLSMQKQLSRGVLRRRCAENMQQIYRRISMSKCGFNKVAKQFYWNHALAWVFSGKFAAYFQKSFFLQNTSGRLILSMAVKLRKSRAHHSRTKFFIVQISVVLGALHCKKITFMLESKSR